MVVAYLRVSGDAQDENSQKLGIQDWCVDNRLAVTRWIVDKAVSGAVHWSKRGLGKWVKSAKSGDCLVASEISRIGRSIQQVLEFVQVCKEKGLLFYTVKDGYRMDGTMQSKVVLTVFALCAEIERDLLVQRTNEGLARARAEGKHIGRPKGSGNPPKLTGKDALVEELLESGLSLAGIGRQLGVCRDTLKRFMFSRGIASPAK